MTHSYLFTYDPNKKEIIRTKYKEIDVVPLDKYDIINSIVYKGDGIMPMISSSNNFDNYIEKLQTYIEHEINKQQTIFDFLSSEIIKAKTSVKEHNELLTILNEEQLHLVSVDKTSSPSDI